jgi:hypothetical protein
MCASALASMVAYYADRILEYPNSYWIFYKAPSVVSSNRQRVDLGVQQNDRLSEERGNRQLHR